MTLKTNGPNLGLLVHGDAGDAHLAAINKLVRGLDSLVQGSVKDKDLTGPPGSPADGDRYIVGPSATGAWATHDDQIARWSVDAPSAWEFFTPKNGWRFYIQDEAKFYKYDGGWDDDDDVTTSLPNDLLQIVDVWPCSGNPGYPDADAGEVFIISAGGRIGGVAGPPVVEGDIAICLVDGSGAASHAIVGMNWIVLHANMAQGICGVPYDIGGAPAYPRALTFGQVRQLLNKKAVLTDSSGHVAWNTNDGLQARVVLDGNHQIDNPTNLVDGDILNLRVIQDGTGTRVPTFGSMWKWQGGTVPTFTTTPGAIDFVSGQYDDTDGSIIANAGLDYS